MGRDSQAVALRELRHVYPGGRQALKGVTFEVARGEVFGLLGPNGGGKSTLFRILSTFFRPTGGSASIFGLDVVRDAAEVRKRIGVVFQNPSLDAKLTVEENLRHHAALYKTRASIPDMLARFGLTDRTRERVSSLSGGLRRRVELAMGLLHSPEVLLLDEPSTGLDPAARRDLWGILEGLDATVVVTTHLMDEADRCDRIALLDQGSVAAIGTPDALKAEVGGDVITIESPRPETLRADIAAKFGQEPTLLGGTLRLETKSGPSFVPKLVEAFPGLVTSVSYAKPTLEDVFIGKTGHRL